MDFFKEINDLKNSVDADLKEYIIRFCAHCLLPVTEYDILKLCKEQKWTAKKAKHLIEELLLENRLEEYNRTRVTHYCLPFEDYPRYFQYESVLEYDSFNALIKRLDNNFNSMNSMRSYLFRYAKKKL